MDFLNSNSDLSDFFEDGACYAVSEYGAANWDYVTCSTIYDKSEGYVEMDLSEDHGLTLDLKSLKMGDLDYYEMKNMTLEGEELTFDVIPTGGSCTEKSGSISITKISLEI